MRTFAQKQKSSQQTTSAKSTIPSRAHFGQSREVNSILHLQRAIGNQAMQRMLQTNAEELDVGLASTVSPRFMHYFSQIPLHPESPSNVQAKLTVGPPGDIYEKEADRVSEQVMRMPEPQLLPALGKEIDENIQAKGQPGNTPAVISKMATNINVLRGGGQPLRETTRRFFEPRFGMEFSRVRVHAGPQAADSARTISARAYTTGQDIVFGAGEYAPETTEGKKLIGHELTHVVQQGASSKIQRKEDDRYVLQITDFPFTGRINTEGTGFHHQPRPAQGNKDYIRPDFNLEDSVTVVGKTPMNWLKVLRTINGETKTGYIDWRYVDFVPQQKEQPKEEEKKEEEKATKEVALQAPWSVDGVKEMLNMTDKGKEVLSSLETDVTVMVCDDIQATELTFIVCPKNPLSVKEIMDMSVEKTIDMILDMDNTKSTELKSIVENDLEEPTFNGYADKTNRKIYIKKIYNNFDAAAILLHEWMHIKHIKQTPEETRLTEEKQIRNDVSDWRAFMEELLGLTDDEKNKSVLPSTDLSPEEREAKVDESKHYALTKHKV
ncbi:MAG: DUF4157 domain-containing protein, partial [Deltaproteobacteria bacterium]|nr:DUF4157 domain-containing protein [Deltaproteobacteria bacterium]